MSRLEMRASNASLNFALILECQFSGNMTNIPAVLQPSSTCQWFRLSTACCQHFTHQPILFLRCDANAYFIGSGCGGSLSFFFSGCCPCFLHLSCSSLTCTANWRIKRDCSQSSLSPFSSGAHSLKIFFQVKALFDRSTPACSQVRKVSYFHFCTTW